MSLELVSKELYGGAIIVQLPSDVIDASDLRQIPDHQEVFLSDKTLTSIVIEINEYQHMDIDLSDSTASVDERAAIYHVTDVLEPPDHLTESGVQTSTVTLSQPSLSKYPAYRSTATIIASEIDRASRPILPLAWQTNPAQKEQQVGLIQLLIRMQDYGTDICVRINVPLVELGNAQSEPAQKEANMASEVMKHIIESLDIKDFSLFGSEP